MNCKNIHDSLKAERAFFLNSPAYASMADRLGTSFLQRLLNEQLAEHIRLKLPSLRDQIQKRIQEMAETVKQFKKFDPSQSGSKMKTLVLYVSYAYTFFLLNHISCMIHGIHIKIGV